MPDKTAISTTREFTEVFNTCKPRFEAIARSYVYDAVVAEDLVQESFSRYWELISDPEGGGTEVDNVPAFILTILKNQCRNYLSRRRRGMEIASELYTDRLREMDVALRRLELFAPEELFTREIAETVQCTLREMPPLTRAVFEKLRYEEKSYREIAAELGISASKIDNEHRKAARLLRRALSDYLPATLIALLVGGIQ